MISGWDVFRMVFYLGMLIGIMYGALYLMKRFIYRSQVPGASPLDLKVISTQMIMPKKFISVVKIQGYMYILGITDFSFTVLDKSTAPPEALQDLKDSESTVLARLKKSINLR